MHQLHIIDCNLHQELTFEQRSGILAFLQRSELGCHWILHADFGWRVKDT